ncbi:MAG: tripartite tricarboxylate transporter substrate binding protein [Alphaproteobacteria bacterium]|nr:tripartite tricarboxylate transporter substrate binding protein [Alphaproteobacteria bacterium]
MSQDNHDESNHALDRRGFLGAAGATGTAVALQISFGSSLAKAADWPGRPVTTVIMYSAGGGTDTVIRALTAEMAKAKGWTITPINKPGAVGGVATRFVDNKQADGYTWLGAANYNKFVRVMGQSDSVAWMDWQYMQAANSLASWSVRTDSPYKTFNDVIAAAKANPGKISISTSGTGGLWHELAAIIADAAGVELKFVPYKGGKPATLAGLQGETDIAGGGVHEHVGLIRDGQLRCLQQTGTEDLDLGNGLVLPTVANFLPELKPRLPVGGVYNIAVKRDTPIEIINEIEDAFVAAVNSDSFKKIAEARFFDIDIRTGEAADRRAALLETVTAATFEKHQKAIGKEIKTAKELGLPTPEGFDAWWPPQGYKPLKGKA